ncbi:MAG TPA: Arc family DNA-binding protein [Roseiarcus sp.]|jgi:plasmid stability protein
MEETFAVVNVRAPMGLKQQIEARAEANSRSVNDEVVAILRQALEAGPQLSINVPTTPAMRGWLSYRATEDHKTECAEIVRLIEEEMREHPLKVYVHELAADSYSVSVGFFGEDFFRSRNQQEAVEAALKKAEELGLPKRGSLAFNSEINSDT